MTKNIALFLSILLYIGQAAANQSDLFYRWIDSNGKIHYSDKVNPDHAGYRREQLNDQGVTVRTIDRPKTKEELAKERELARLRKQQQKLIAQQAARDRLLLFTFEDVTNSLGDKLETIDVKLKILTASIQDLQGKLTERRKSAANWEKSGRAVPRTVLFKIDEFKSQIQGYESTVEELTKKREQLQVKYAEDTQRYKQLVSHQYDKINAEKSISASQSQDELSIVSCSDKKECGLVWQLTKEYILSNPGGKKLITDSDLVVSTSAPQNQEDIGASAVMIRKGSGQSTIFLDIHCKQTVIGQEQCNSSGSKNWLNGFKAYVLSRMKAQDAIGKS